MNNDVAGHYDLLIDENNDPVHDPKPLRDYMDKWDGPTFIDKMNLHKDMSILEIGVGTGRIAVKTVCGIDISPKTIIRARKNLAEFHHVTLICGDFLEYDFSETFDVIYSSLTFMHIEDTQGAIHKTATLLNDRGRFVLSIDKNQKTFIDMGTRTISIFPDNAMDVRRYIDSAGFTLEEQYETEFAYIFVSKK